MLKSWNHQFQHQYRILYHCVGFEGNRIGFTLCSVRVRHSMAVPAPSDGEHQARFRCHGMGQQRLLLTEEKNIEKDCETSNNNFAHR